MKETYRFQYEEWHQDTPESRKSDIDGSTVFIDAHGAWPKFKSAKIFDVGSGMGRLLLAFRDRGYKNVSGIDIDDYQVLVAKKEKIDVQLSDANVYFSKNTKHYDLITMIDCLEHVDKENQIDLLKLIYKSLSNDGCLMIRVPNALAPAFAYFRYIDFTHKWSYTDESLRYVLKNAGFEHIVLRPAWQESSDIAELKASHAKLLKTEFGMNDPILTANMVAMVFKSEKAFDEYKKIAPSIDIKYETLKTKSWWKKIFTR